MRFYRTSTVPIGGLNCEVPQQLEIVRGASRTYIYCINYTFLLLFLHTSEHYNLAAFSNQSSQLINMVNNLPLKSIIMSTSNVHTNGYFTKNNNIYY